MTFVIGPPPGLPEFKFYNGTETLIFDPEPWIYWRVMPDGTRVAQDGVTKVLHITIDRSNALMPWAVKMAMIRLKELLVFNNYVGETAEKLFEETLDKIIAEAKKADKEHLEAAADIGTAAHAWLEEYIKAILEANDEKRLALLAHLPADEKVRSCVLACLEWAERHNVRWLASERKIFSREYGFAGTMDGLAVCDSCDDPLCCGHAFKDRLSLIDFKTSNYLYISYLFQTAAYQHAYQEEMSEAIEDRWVLRLPKTDESKFEPWHAEGKETFEADFAGFRHAQGLAQSLETTGERVAEIRDKIREAKRLAKQVEKDAQNLLTCPVSKVYTGSRRKSGCNGTAVWCEACLAKYAEKHEGRSP